MAELARRRLTREQFYEWIAGRGGRYELVDGLPVMMAGATRRHDRIATNLLVLIGNALRGKPCRPFTSDTYVRIPAGNARQPDLGIDCGNFDDDSLEAAEPSLVVEILSPSTSFLDQTEKVEEYQTVPSIAHILVIDPSQPRARLYTRDDGGGWSSQRLAGIDAELALPRFGVLVPFADLYEGLTFRVRPMLVEAGDPHSDQT